MSNSFINRLSRYDGTLICHLISLSSILLAIGAILYYIVLQAALQLGLNTNDLKLVTALIVAVFLAIPYWKGKAFHGKAQKGGAHHA